MIWKLPYYDEVTNTIDWNSLIDVEWFKDMKGVPQDAIWHAEGDVQTHTIMVCEALINLSEFKELSIQEKHIMVTAALMHDIEKRSTTKEEERYGRICIVAPKHANKGEFTSRTILYKDFETPFNIREQICMLVRYHGIPLWKSNDDSINLDIVSASQYLSIKLVSMIAKADVLGRISSDNSELLDKIEFFKMMSEELGCYDSPRLFKSDLARYTYLSTNGFIDYVPFDETKFTCHMLMGVAGSGKDFYVKNGPLQSDMPIVSLDDLRISMKVKRGNTKFQGHMIQAAKELFKVNMRKGESFIFNATNLTKDVRDKWISLVREYGGRVSIHYIEVPYKKLLKQNKDREYPIPEEAIEKMITKIEMPKYDEAEEIYFNV
jgi:predicted kinase